VKTSYCKSLLQAAYSATLMGKVSLKLNDDSHIVLHSFSSLEGDRIYSCIGCVFIIYGNSY
jgi:hypothetical protein